MPIPLELLSFLLVPGAYPRLEGSNPSMDASHVEPGLTSRPSAETPANVMTFLVTLYVVNAMYGSTLPNVWMRKIFFGAPGQ